MAAYEKVRRPTPRHAHWKKPRVAACPLWPGPAVGETEAALALARCSRTPPPQLTAGICPQDSWVWYNHETETWIPAKVTEGGSGDIAVELEDTFGENAAAGMVPLPPRPQMPCAHGAGAGHRSPLRATNV